MAHSDSTYNSLDNSLLPAILISIGLHVLAVAFLHPFQFDANRALPQLEVVLQPPKPVPPPEPKPEPVKPEQPKPLPKKASPPSIKTPSPQQPEKHVNSSAPTVTPPPPVMAMDQVKETEPTFAAPPTEPEKPKGPSPQEADTALGDYGSLLAREFAKHKQYPRIAQMRGWQGTVRVKLEVDANGIVISSSVSESSGFEALDKQALEMANKVTPLPPRPEALRHRPFAITVPVLFRLE